MWSAIYFTTARPVLHTRHYRPAAGITTASTSSRDMTSSLYDVIIVTSLYQRHQVLQWSVYSPTAAAAAATRTSVNNYSPPTDNHSVYYINFVVVGYYRPPFDHPTLPTGAGCIGLMIN